MPRTTAQFTKTPCRSWNQKHLEYGMLIGIWDDLWIIAGLPVNFLFNNTNIKNSTKKESNLYMKFD